MIKNSVLKNINKGMDIMKKVDRTGEERINNFGSKMVIVEYRKNSDVDIYIFP